MVAEIDAPALRDGDTPRGVVEVLAYGLPPGLGSHVHWDRRLDSRLAGALMGIQAIKGVAVGDGFESARRRGSAAHDEIERDENGALRRRTARAGGIEGGMSTGEPLRVRAAMKPISTVPRALDTVDTATGEPAVAIGQRSDVCRAVPAAGIVAEAMVGALLADAVLEKFGGDSVDGRRVATSRAISTTSRSVDGASAGLRRTTRLGEVDSRLASSAKDARRGAHTDDDIEAGRARASATSSSIRAKLLRALEAAGADAALAEHDGVLAVGGGAILDEHTRASLNTVQVVFLDVGITDAAKRIGFNRDRPLLLGNPRAQWIRLMEARRPLYEQIATHTVTTDGKSADEVAADVVAR